MSLVDAGNVRVEAGNGPVYSRVRRIVARVPLVGLGWGHKTFDLHTSSTISGSRGSTKRE